MELLDEGGEHLFEEAKANRKRISEQNTDINYIAEHLDEGKLSSESVLMLFDLPIKQALIGKTRCWQVLRSKIS